MRPVDKRTWRDWQRIRSHLDSSKLVISLERQQGLIALSISDWQVTGLQYFNPLISDSISTSVTYWQSTQVAVP